MFKRRTSTLTFTSILGIALSFVFSSQTSFTPELAKHQVTALSPQKTVGGEPDGIYFYVSRIFTMLVSIFN